MISSEQCKAGRAVLNWTQAVLAKESGVSIRAIQEFELKTRSPNHSTLQALLAALQRSGIILYKDGAGITWGEMRGIQIDPRKIGREHELE